MATRASSRAVPTASCTKEKEASACWVPATILTTPTATSEKEEIPPKARSTVTGCTEYSGTRPPALATGPAGTEPPQSSSVLVDCSTTRRLTPATGLRMLLAARNILCAKMMPTVTFPLGSRVTGIGPAREDTPGCRGAPPCWSSIRTEDCEVPTTKAPPPGEENENNFSGPGDQPQQSPNPRRGGGQRRAPPPRPVGGEPLPFNLPPGAVPLN